MKESYELNEEELSSIAGGTKRPRDGDRVVVITPEKDSIGPIYIIKESKLADWQAKNPEKAANAEYAHGQYQGLDKRVIFD